MSDGYDNTNRGALFQTRGNSEVIREGDLNINGVDGRVMLVKTQTDKGPMFFLYRKIGAMFPQEKQRENSPDTSGPLDFDGLRVAGWKNVSSKGTQYTSLLVSKRERQSGGRQSGGGYDQSPPANGNGYGAQSGREDRAREDWDRGRDQGGGADGRDWRDEIDDEIPF